LYGNYVGIAGNRQFKRALLEYIIQLPRGAKQVLKQIDSILVGKPLGKWPCRKSGNRWGHYEGY